MNEQEWLECIDPISMLAFLGSKLSDRKLRLFAVAGARQWSFKDNRLGEILNTGESFADQGANWNELSKARKMAKTLHKEASQRRGTLLAGDGPSIVQDVLAAVHPNANVAALNTARFWRRHPTQSILRDIFGNPFRHVAINPSWVAWNDGTVCRLAQGIYDERAFDRLPMLADALQDAGCDNVDLLQHCRSEGPHVRGCWVVDLLLGKE